MQKKNWIFGVIFLGIVLAALVTAGRTVRRINELEAALAQESLVKGVREAGEVQSKKVKSGAGLQEANAANKAQMNEEIAQETSQEHVERVYRQALEENLPQEVIELLQKNPETVDFVENYSSYQAGELITASGEEEVIFDEVPLFIQWDERWGYKTFGTSMIAISGCGPTCMAMVVAGLTGDLSITPDVIADYEVANGYVDGDNNTYWSFMREGGSFWGISAREERLTESEVAAELQAGHPIICSMGPGDFTDQGHFIVLTSYENGCVTVNDPFSRKNSEGIWSFSQIQDQIKNMWIYWV